jgi:archaellum component FlaF (FlaF/FlaG flagellin family)
MVSNDSKIYKYTIFEFYPPILRHNIPLFTIIISITFFIISIFYFILSLKKNLKNIFKKRIKKISILGPTPELNYKIEADAINKLNNAEVDYKAVTFRTDITLFKNGSESVNKLKELIHNGIIDRDQIQYLPSTKNFTLREDIIHINDGLNRVEFVVVNGYNDATIKTMNLFKFLGAKK